MQILDSPIAAHSADGNDRPTSDRLVHAPIIRVSEIISALSVALDITQGHPQGHSMRSCLIGMRIAESLKLSAADRSALFYALLLKDLGCSSNAAKIAYLFGADDQFVKHQTRLVDWTNPGSCLKHAWNCCSPGGSSVEKLLRMARSHPRQWSRGGEKSRKSAARAGSGNRPHARIVRSHGPGDSRSRRTLERARKSSTQAGNRDFAARSNLCRQRNASDWRIKDLHGADSTMTLEMEPSD